MPGRRRVSFRQMEMLVEFAESHRDIALGRFPGGPQASRVSREVWDSVAIQLNSVAEGITKTPDQWRRYWIEFKAKTKGKAADSRRNASATGGGPNKLVPLTELEKRVLAVVGPVAVEGLPGVSLPRDTSSHNETAQVPSDSGEPLMEVEWLEDIPSPLRVQPGSQTVATSSVTQPALSPSPVTQPVLSPVTQDALSRFTETEPAAAAGTAYSPVQAGEQHRVASRQDRPAQLATQPAQTSRSPSRRSRSRRQNERNERVPRWAYNMEMRRIAAEERLAAAVEEMVRLIREIRDNYVHQ